MLSYFKLFVGRMDIKETDNKRLTHNLRRPFGIGCKLCKNIIQLHKVTAVG